MTPGTLHVTCGKMAAGKTTCAQGFAREIGAVLVVWDLWLQRLYPTEIAGFDDFLRYSGRLRTTMAPHLAGLLERGLDVVLDFPANTPASRGWVRGIAQAAGGLVRPAAAMRRSDGRASGTKPLADDRPDIAPSHHRRRDRRNTQQKQETR